MNRARLTAIAQTLAVISVGCLAGVLAKRSLGTVDPFTFVWLQIGIGGGLLTIYTFVVRRERIPRGLDLRVWIYVALLGVGNFTIVRVMFMLSLARLPANTHIFLVNFVSFVTMLVSVVMLRERPSRWQVFGCLIAFIGLWIFFDEIPAASQLTGLILVAIGVLALAFTNNLARKLALVSKGELSNNVVSTVALWIGGIPVVVFGLVRDGVPAIGGAEHWWVIVLNSVVGIAIGLTVWNYILRTLRSYEASVLGGSSVIFVTLFAIPILGEYLRGYEIAGIGLMLVGLVLSQVRRHGR